MIYNDEITGNVMTSGIGDVDTIRKVQGRPY